MTSVQLVVGEHTFNLCELAPNPNWIRMGNLDYNVGAILNEKRDPYIIVRIDSYCALCAIYVRAYSGESIFDYQIIGRQFNDAAFYQIDNASRIDSIRRVIGIEDERIVVEARVIDGNIKIPPET